MKLPTLFTRKPAATADAPPLNERLAPGPASDAPSGPSPSRPKPARTTIGLPGLASRTSTGGPTRPDLGEAPRPIAPAAGRAMTPARADATARQVHRAMDTLHPVAHPASGLPRMPDSHAGMNSEAGFRGSMLTMFGHTPEATALSTRVLAAVPPAPGSAAPFIAPLVLGTAMNAIGVTTPAEADAMLQTAARGEHTPALFRLERLLAQTAPGTEALGHLRQLQGQPARLDAMRDSLNLCAALERKGVGVNAHASVAGLAEALRAMPELRLDRPVGQHDDAPLQLLAQALVHADRVGRGEPAADSPQRAAFVAWKKGGFTESGPGTDFNHTIERLHKFSTYVDRADHGPRTIANMARDVGAWIGRTVGVGKSPLTPMRLGTQGGDLGRLHEEAAKYRAGLNRALATAVDHLVDELHDPAIQQDPVARNGRLARAAVFDLWRENGGTKIDLTDVFDRAHELVAGAGGALGGVHEPSLLLELRKFTSMARTDDGAPAVRVGLPALEATGTGRRQRHGAAAGAEVDPAALRTQIQHLRNLPVRDEVQQARLIELQGQRRLHIASILKEMRGIERADGGTIPLFKVSDLKAMLRGSPRDGPLPADAQRVMNALATARYESMATYGDGTSRGAGTFGAALLDAGSSLGAPLVYPVVRAETGKRAAVTVGVSNTGGRLVVGTETSSSATVGVGGGWASPALFKLATAAGLAEVTGSYARSQGAGAAITTRNDLPGWQEKLPQVVDFLFDEARRPQGQGDACRAGDASQLWSRFADRFGDDPHVAVGWIGEASSNASVQASATAVARVAVGEQASIGPAFTAGARAEGGRFERTPAADGADVPLALRQRRLTANAAVTLTETAPAVASGDKHVTGWGSAMPLVGASWEWNIAGGLGVARLGRTREGELSPGLCHRELIFQQPERLIAFANLHRTAWEAAMVAKDPTGATTPDVARQRFNAFLQQVADTPRRADRLYGEQMALNPAVAAQINRYEARLTTLLGSGDRQAAARALGPAERAECNALQNEAQRLLAADESWEHAGIYAVEVNQTTHTTGLNFGLRSVNQEQARAARLTSLLVASIPED